ncbi:MAG: ABC transporter permease [Gemmatimonadaceae bacterium]|nr:ABC transporter permease [Gemmatimonadaceae bacterium]
MSDLIFQWLRIAAPYLCAAAGGVLSERAGVIALTLEGYLLAGAFGAAMGALATGAPWLGVAAGVGAAMAVAALHATATLRFRADQVVTAVALNLLVDGGSTFLLRRAYDSSANSPRVEGFGSGGWLGSPVGYVALLMLPLVWWLLSRTAFGLRVRAVGEKPEAATASGISVARVRWLAVLGSGALAGLGGAYLALDQHKFSAGMTAGRGFIALAAVIFGRWDPLRTAGACLLFAAAETLQIRLQGTAALPSQFTEMIPYVLTIVALATLAGRAAAPAALGRNTP